MYRRLYWIMVVGFGLMVTEGLEEWEELVGVESLEMDFPLGRRRFRMGWLFHPHLRPLLRRRRMRAMCPTLVLGGAKGERV